MSDEKDKPRFKWWDDPDCHQHDAAALTALSPDFGDKKTPLGGVFCLVA